MSLEATIKTNLNRVPFITLRNGRQMPMIGLGTWRVCIPHIYTKNMCGLGLTVKLQNNARSLIIAEYLFFKAFSLDKYYSPAWVTLCVSYW